MSNGEAPSEDRTILAAVESLERGIEAPGGGQRADEATETLTRLYTEVLGLLPYELAPVQPSAEVQERLMAAIHGDETQPAAGPAPAAAPPRSSEEIRPPRAAPAAPPLAAVRRPAPRRWPRALAAVLFLWLLGISAWLFLRVRQQEQAIARLEQELIAERDQVEEAVAEARRMQAAARALRERLDLVTSPAVLVSPLRPAGSPPLQPGARGVLFVASDHQHWHLSLEGLEPPPTGKTYKLWFVADAGTVSAGSFTARPGTPVELSSETMPAGTRETLVTIEDDPEAPAPAGPEVLRSAAPVQIG